MEHCLTCCQRGRCEVGINLSRTHSLLRHLAPLQYRRYTDIIMRRAATNNCPVEAEAICVIRGHIRRRPELAHAC
jgi:hypothetical protein